MKMDPVRLRFCEEFGITTPQFKKMARLVNHAVRMQVRESGEDSDDVRKAAATATTVVENYAKECGFTRVQWDDGFYPRFYKDTKNGVMPLDD